MTLRRRSAPDVHETPWLDRYSGQSTGALIALASEYRLDSICAAFYQAIRAKERGGANLTFAERVVVAVESVGREVHNGGFNQLFVNSSRRYLADYRPAMEAIGRADVGRLVQQAIDELGLGPAPAPDAARQAAIDADTELDERLDELDSRYYTVAGDLSP